MVISAIIFHPKVMYLYPDFISLSLSLYLFRPSPICTVAPLLCRLFLSFFFLSLCLALRIQAILLLASVYSEDDSKQIAINRVMGEMSFRVDEKRM